MNQSRRSRVISALALALFIGYQVYQAASPRLRREDDLRLAAARGRAVTVQRLLDKGVDVNCRDVLGTTPLIEAAEGNHTAVAKYLLSKGAQINARDKHGDSALAHAVRTDSADMVELLLSKNADISAVDPIRNTTMLYRATMNGNTRITKLLIEHGADVNARDSAGDTPIDTAGSRTIMEILLRHGAKVDNLKTAVRLDDVKLTKNLLKKTPKELNDALIAATDFDSINAAEFLISNGADPTWHDKEGDSLAKYAAQSGSVKVLELLLDKGAKPGIADMDGKTPLHYAAENNQPSAAGVLLNHKADPNVRTKRGYTPLYYAATYSKSRRIANLLLSHGADPNDTYLYSLGL